MLELELLDCLLATADNETDVYTVRTKTVDAEGKTVAKSATSFASMPVDSTLLSEVQAAKHGTTTKLRAGAKDGTFTRTGIVAANIIGKLNGIAPVKVREMLKDADNADAAKVRAELLAAELRKGIADDELSATEQRANTPPVKPETPKNGKPVAAK